MGGIATNELITMVSGSMGVEAMEELFHLVSLAMPSPIMGLPFPVLLAYYEYLGIYGFVTYKVQESGST